MIWHPEVVVPGAAFIAAWWLTGRFLRFALARQILDVPNARSSHEIAAPRGGGIAIAASVIAALLVLLAIRAVPARFAVGLLGGGAIVATIGMIDDARHVAARWRLLAHIVSAAWLLYWIGGLPPGFSGGQDLGTAGYLVGVLYIVWILNLTNFMDGIDGIAAIESVTVCVGGAVIYILNGFRGEVLYTPLVVATASLGFLKWNWPPARIFMGDVGSGFLGLALAACSLAAGLTESVLFWSWIILMGVFVVDATVTLIRRLIGRQKFYQAHRSHAYQHAAQRWGGHRPVTLTVAAINVFWLFPLALVVAQSRVSPLVGVAIAYTPLVVAALWLKAGEGVLTPASRKG